MAELTESRDYQVKGPVLILDVEAAGNDTYYRGAMLVANANGFADVPTDTANQLPLGVYTGRQGQIVAVANGSHTKLELESGHILIPHSGAMQADVGKLFYLSDDGDVSETAGAKTWALKCKGWKPGFLLLDFASPVRTA